MNQTFILLYLCFPVKGMLVLKRAILHQLELVRSVAAVLLSSVVLLLALRALQRDLLHRSFLLASHYNILLNRYGR